MSDNRIPVLLDQVQTDVLQRNLQAVFQNLESNRYQDQPRAKLIAVTKTVTPRIINELNQFGIVDIGENRAQVALPKLPMLEHDYRLHWIGRLQSNKVASVIDHIYMLHSLDRMSLAQEVDRCAQKRGIRLPALVQVNIANEPQKGGMPVEEVRDFLRILSSFQGISVKGLMGIMPIDADEDALTKYFRGMRSLFDQLKAEAVNGIDMEELSIGMSRDYCIAAREGATMVRVGTALYHNPQ